MNKPSKAPWHWGVHPSHGDDSAVMESLIDADGNEVLWLGDSARYDPRSGYVPDLADKRILQYAPALLEGLEKSARQVIQLCFALEKGKPASPDQVEKIFSLAKPGTLVGDMVLLIKQAKGES